VAAEQTGRPRAVAAGKTGRPRAEVAEKTRGPGPNPDLRLDDVRGFVFDIDGTLVHRSPDGRARPAPGAVEVLERIRASGRPLVLFTNASHVASEQIARGLSEDGLPVADDEVLTPIESTLSYLRRNRLDGPVLLFATQATRERMAQAGVTAAQGEDAEVVFVAHVNEIDLGSLERAARAVLRGAPLLTGSYVSSYAGANGPIFSRGAMVTAAIAKASGARPKVVGKPSRAALAEMRARLELSTSELAVIGDDLGMDIALGRIGGSRTVLVRSGISGQVPLERIPERARPDAIVDTIADLLTRL
jgi:HAD superfamily hydrolase (TIGR01450 family)